MSKTYWKEAYNYQSFVEKEEAKEKQNQWTESSWSAIHLNTDESNRHCCFHKHGIFRFFWVWKTSVSRKLWVATTVTGKVMRSLVINFTTKFGYNNNKHDLPFTVSGGFHCTKLAKYTDKIVTCFGSVPYNPHPGLRNTSCKPVSLTVIFFCKYQTMPTLHQFSNHAQIKLSQYWVKHLWQNSPEFTKQAVTDQQNFSSSLYLGL